MTQQDSRQLHGLDHLRAAAITYVFLFHYFILSGGAPSWLPDAVRFGWTGVDLFFVLSGFLISAQLFASIKEGHGVSFRDFFIRRFFRIIPAYAVTLLLYYCVPVFREKERLPPMWKLLTFTQNFGLDLLHYGTFSHAWSLCVEEHFYLLLPVALWLLLRYGVLRKGWLLLPLLVLAGLLLRTWSYTQLYLPVSDAEDAGVQWYRYLYYPSYNRLDGLLAGVGLAAIWHFVPRLRALADKHGNALLLIGLALLIPTCMVCYDPMRFTASVWGFPLVALAYGVLVAGAVSNGSVLYRRSSRITALIAKLSYAVYLTHKGIIHLTHLWLSDYITNANLLLALSALNCLLFAGLLHLLVERPFMRLRARMVQSARAAN